MQDVLVYNNNASNFIAQKYLADKPLWKMTQDQLAPLYLKANSVRHQTLLHYLPPSSPMAHFNGET